MGFNNHTDTAHDQNTSQDESRGIDHGISNKFIYRYMAPYDSKNPKVMAQRIRKMRPTSSSILTIDIVFPKDTVLNRHKTP